MGDEPSESGNLKTVGIRVLVSLGEESVDGDEDDVPVGGRGSLTSGAGIGDRRPRGRWGARGACQHEDEEEACDVAHG
jgi:hypothetical protein